MGGYLEVEANYHPKPPDPTGLYESLGSRLGSLVDRKREQYGDSFHTFNHLLDVLYPDGISSDQYSDALAIIRVLDKLCRISRGNQGDENAWNDIAGYAILMSKE